MLLLVFGSLKKYADERYFQTVVWLLV